VVCLSEFAGAASLLGAAVRINPWDVEGTAGRLYEALQMRPEERRRRHRTMLAQLLDYTASDWARAFMSQLARAERLPGHHGLPPRADAAALRVRLADERVLLLLDYDGTLVPLAPSPEAAELPSDVAARLARLLVQPSIEGVVVSGRTATFMARQLGALPVALAAEHGAQFRRAGARRWTTLVRTDVQTWYPVALALMEDFRRRTPGSRVERKKFAVAWHHRQVPGRFGEHQARRLLIELEAALTNLPATATLGHRVVEARAAEANKGAFYRWLVTSRPAGWSRIVAIGDDTTDEELFAALPEDAITVRVGRVPSRARWRLDEQTEVLPFLEALFAPNEVSR